VRISRRRRHLRVPEQLTDDRQSLAGSYRLRRKGVPQVVNTGVLQAGAGAHSLPERLRVNVGRRAWYRRSPMVCGQAREPTQRVDRLLAEIDGLGVGQLLLCSRVKSNWKRGNLMTIASKWVEDARRRLCDDRKFEEKAYENFLQVYRQAENDKRAESRNQRGCLTKDWRPEHLSDKTVLIVGENGIGDEVLTIGCLSTLAHRCRHVAWQGNPKLKVLFTRSFPGFSFVSNDFPEPTAGGTIYSWELIGRFRKSLNDFGWTMGGNFRPYLEPSGSLKDRLRARYADGSKKLVGIAWRSERNGARVSEKTCDLRDVPAWAAFFERLKDKVRFVSVQYGDTDDEIAFARWKYSVEIYQDKSLDIYNDVDGAAAQIAVMDYMVSIATTAAHLAGALAIPGWVLLPKTEKLILHWRPGKKICPWYPTLRPIRQLATEDWKSVLTSVTEELVNELNVIDE
jgi:hypothetical protein